MNCVVPSPAWRIVSVVGPDDGDHAYRLQLERGDETAYVDVQAWEDRHGDARLEVLAECPAGDALGREAADALRCEDEQALAWAVLDGRAYVLETRRAA